MFHNTVVSVQRNNIVSELDAKKIITLMETTLAVVKRKLEKNQACMGFEPYDLMTSAIPVQRSNQLS